MDAFAPARSLYQAAGFSVCPPFAGYWDSPNSVCMTLSLD
jgi:putative acetyltransferase